MRKSFIQKLMCAAALMTVAHANAQEPKATWGNDVVVSPAAGKYYKNTCVSVAYDGAIFVGRLIADAPTAAYQRWEVLKSVDTGHTFVFYAGSSTSGTQSYHAFDIIAAGANATDFKLFVGRTIHDSAAAGTDYVYLSVYDGLGNFVTDIVDETSTFPNIFNRGWESVCLASDWKDPNPSSSPYSISMAAQRSGTPNDSVVVWTSYNAGTNLSRRSLYGTVNFIRNVSAASGSTVSTTSTYGRLGIAWDEFPSSTDEWGSINCQFVYNDDATSPGVNGGVTQVGSTTDHYRKPSICLSQQTGTVTGNGSDDFVTLITYESNAGPSGLTSVFTRMATSLAMGTFDISTSVTLKEGSASGGAMDPHSVYDPAYNNFMITYYDSATQALVYSLKALSSAVNTGASIFKANYRDATTNLGVPAYPRVDINTANQRAVFVWNDDHKSMLDAEYAVLPSSVQSVLNNVGDVQVFPNPVNDQVNIGFVATEADDVTVSISDVSGRRIKNTKAVVNSGLNKISIEANDLPAGNYFIEVKGSVLNFNARFMKQ